MRIALLVLTIFAALWAWAGLEVSGAAPRLVLLPIAVSLALLGLGWQAAAMVPSRGPKAGKLVGLWSIVEIAAIIITANVLHIFHRGDLMFPMCAIIVGLHFFPLAHGIPVRLYHATGAALVVTGLIGILIPPTQRPVAVGTIAALILWATALALALRARRSCAT